MKKIHTLFLLFTVAFCNAQPAAQTPEIPLARKYFHEHVDAAQRSIWVADGKPDGKFTPDENDETNRQLTIAATAGVDSLQNLIEADNLLDNNNKIKFLRALSEVLGAYRKEYTFKTMKASALSALLTAFEQGIHPEINNQSIEKIIYENSYEIGNILIKSVAYSENAGIETCKQIVLLKYIHLHPEKTLLKLSQEPDAPFTDSLIVEEARRNPDGVYTYAMAYNKLAAKIQNNTDPLVQIIAKLAKKNTGRQFFPFIDNIYHNKITMERIDSVMNNDTKYYSLLVKTEIDYADRLRMRDTPLAMQSLTHRLAVKAKEVYVNEINGLHDLPDNVRFRKIDNLTPQELYYLAVLCEEEIYTSSYVRGVYARVWQPKKMTRGDSLLMSVRFDHFKKWIKMAANYNTLDNFLSRMDKENAQLLMKAFINGLDKTNSLEDAVDVANSFASISDKKIRELILSQVQYNLTQARNSEDKKATDIYSILNTLFLSIDTSNKIDVSKKLGIPPVYFMPNKMMQDTAGKIVIQQFFYGDKDGQGIFNNFINSFRNAGWKVSLTEQWATVSSTKGTPVVIYSNKPLDEKKNLDDEAQAALCDYLIEHNIEPTFVIHRGHSYYLSSTLKRLAPSAKVILLGSCGGYQSLNTVLQTCPSAQIIASKQTGSGTINQPMISNIVDMLRSGKDLNWPKMWASFDNMFKSNPLFADYVPPHKNLGAVFIMAYNKLQETNESNSLSKN